MWKSCIALHNCVASYMQSLLLLHFKVVSRFEEPQSLLPRVTAIPASLTFSYYYHYYYFQFCRCSSLIWGIFFSLVALICLICLDLNTLSFFYSSPTSPPVHCKQQRGKCSLSQAGPSVSSPHHRYLSVGFQDTQKIMELISAWLAPLEAHLCFMVSPPNFFFGTKAC